MGKEPHTRLKIMKTFKVTVADSYDKLQRVVVYIIQRESEREALEGVISVCKNSGLSLVRVSSIAEIGENVIILK